MKSDEKFDAAAGMESLRYHQYLEEMMVEVYMAEGKDAFDSIVDGAKGQVNYDSEKDNKD